MEIILSKQCESLTGTLDVGFGYFVVRRGDRFFSQRSRHSVPPDGHWRFIVACAELAQNRLYIADIRVTQEEVDAARMKAGLKPIAYCFPCRVLDAGDVIYIVKHYSL